MPFTNEDSLSTKIMALLIGPTGSGKTLAGASFAESGDMEFADFDGRMKPVTLYYPKSRIHYTEFNMKNVHNFVYDYLRRLTNNCPYKNFQLAGITSFSTASISFQMYEKGDEGKKTKGGLRVPSWDEFSGEAMLLGQALDAMRALPCNVFVEAHPVNRTNLTSATKYTSLVAFGPKIESIIPGYFDEVWYFDVERDINGGIEYVMYTKPAEGRTLAKTSLPLPARIVLSSPEGKPLSLYKIIQGILNDYNITIGGEVNEVKKEDVQVL